MPDIWIEAQDGGVAEVVDEVEVARADIAQCSPSLTDKGDDRMRS